MCQMNGSWIDIPSCNPVPCDLLNIPNASFEPDQTQLKYNESVRVTCNSGYLLEGNDTLKCSENGSWIDIPTCYQVHCDQLNIPHASLDPDKTQFKYNESVRVTCNSGYLLEGNDTLKCNENGSWVAIPTCNQVHCDQLNIPNASLDPDKTQYKYNESVRVTCNHGYLLEGNATLKCNENGSWVNIPTCNQVYCDQLNIPNASLDPDKTQYKYNESVRVTCNHGYLLEGNDTLKCNENGSWINIPTCYQVHCDQLNIPNASLDPDKTKYKYNESVRLTCNHGYLLEGNDTLMCLENGSWIDIPTCKQVLCYQLNIPNASFDPDKTQYKYNESVRLTCNHGYSLEGNDTLMCLENGSWIDIPTCNPVLCDQLNIPNASFEPDQTQFNYNESVHVTCDSGYLIEGNDTLNCLENGSWIDIPTCNPVPCDQLNIPNALLEPDQSQFKYNESVSVTCKSGYSLERNATLKCNENGSWINIPTCNQVHCDQLNIPNASLDPDKTHFKYSESLSVTCKSGYLLEGNDTLMCQMNGSWIDRPSCNPVPCDLLNIQNASFEPDQTQLKYNESVRVTCNSGYFLEGNDTLKCNENGSWIDIPTCNQVLCDQLNITNASLDPDKTQYKYNESVRLTCNHGYLLEGNDTLMCLENGSWIDIPTCNQVLCDQLNITNASFEPDRTQFKYNESVRLTCDSGYLLEGNDTLKCNENGSWIYIPTCNQVLCDQLNITNASFEPDRTQFKYNESVRLTCDSGYLLEGNDTLMCLENGSWIYLPACYPVTCDLLNITNALFEPDQTQFKYNESLSVTCKSGYLLEGNDTLKCNENGSWVNIPTCNQVHCDQPNIPNASLEPDQSQFKYNESVRVTCNHGYLLEGNETLMCLGNGSWIDIPTCNQVHCDQLNIPNASFEPDQSQFKYNESVTVTCNHGYLLEGNETLMCLGNGSWIDIPTCNQVLCDQLNITNASFEPDQTQLKYNESVRVTCNSGYLLEGNDTLKCNENGSWIDIPTCNQVLCDQLNITNASLDPDKTQYKYNESVRLTCNHGYLLEGNDTLMCLENGSWIDIPTCNPVLCDQLNITNASFEPDRTQFKYNESVRLTCDSGYLLEGNDTLMCKKNGSWIDIPTCNPVLCDQLNITNASFEPDRTQFKYNESVRLTCDSGYLLEGNDTLMCLENGSWIDIPTCNPVLCDQLNITNASFEPDRTQFKYNESVRLTCDSGYLLEGNDTLMCLENGSWIDIPTCNQVLCYQLNITNASFEPDRTQFKYNESVRLTCDSGYLLEGNDTLMCLENGSWIYLPTCYPVPCDLLNITNALFEPDQTQFKYNESLSVTCKSGYLLEGNATLKCNENGSWVNIPTCNQVHCDQLNIPNASFEPDRTQFKYNESVRVTCNHGYLLEGNDTLKCNENGSWIDIPTCNQVLCDQLNIPNASFEPDQSQFKYNESVRVTCNHGYLLEGNETLMCQMNGSWIDIPTCNQVHCDQLNIPNASLEPDQSQFKYNESVRVTCNHGYLLEGNDTLKCLENGSWIDIPTCNQVLCDQLNIPNASFEPDQTQFKYNESVHVTCDSGYLIEGNDNLMCHENGSWIDIPTCNQVLCDQLNIPNASFEPGQTQFKYNESVRVTCNHGYLLEGNDTLKCLENGSWIDIPTCNQVFCDQLNIPNASFEPDQTQFKYNESVHVTCDSGYLIEGNDNLMCHENGSWIDIPTCNLIPCDELNIPNSLLDPNKSQFKYNESVSVTCDSGYSLEGNDTLKCLENGSWIDIPTCNAVPCEQLNIPNASFEPGQTQFRYNESVRVTCNIGYLLEGNDTLKCLENGSWINIPTCTPVLCDLPRIENANVVPEKTNYTYNENVTVQCMEGFQLEGNEVNICNESGTWINSTMCIPVQCEQPSIENSELIPNKTEYTYNENVTIRCEIGYTLDGDEIVYCAANSTWTDVSLCIPVKCELFNLPENAFVSTKQETYFYNENVTLECRDGYELEGYGTISCQGNTSWTELPICKPITCERFQLQGSNETGTNYTGLTFEDELSVSCNKGFILVGYNNIRCNSNGTWPDINCVAVNCSTDAISKLENSVIVGVNELVPSFEISCTEGYQLVGNSSVTCLAGNWSEIPTCEIVNCGSYVPTNKTYVFDSDNVTTYNSSLNVTCTAGLGFTNDSATVITCGANGQWNGVPICNITGKVSFTKDVYSLIEGEDESIVCDVTEYPNWQTIIVARLDLMNTGSYTPIVRIFHDNESVVNETLDDINYITRTRFNTDGVSVTVTFQEGVCNDEGVYICAAVVGIPTRPIEIKQVRTNVSFSCSDGCGEYISNTSINSVQPNETTLINTSVPVQCIDGLEFTNGSTTYVTCGADRKWSRQPECKIPGIVSFSETAYSFEVGDTGMIICEVKNYSSWQQVLVAKLNHTGEQGSPVALVTKGNGTLPSVNIFSANATTHEDGVTVSVILNPSVCTDEGMYSCAAIVGDITNPIDIVLTSTNVTFTPCT